MERQQELFSYLSNELDVTALQTQIREFLKEWFGVDAPLPNEDLTLKL